MLMNYSSHTFSSPNFNKSTNYDYIRLTVNVRIIKKNYSNNASHTTVSTVKANYTWLNYFLIISLQMIHHWANKK